MSSSAYGHLFNEVETQRWVASLIFASVERYLPKGPLRFNDIMMLGHALAGERKKNDGPLDLPVITMSPVTRGVSICLALSGPMAIEGVESYELTVDGEPLAPEWPIETEGLRPGDHLVSLVAAAADGKVRSSLILSVVEPVELGFASDRLNLKYGAKRKPRSVTATAILTNRTPHKQSVTVSILSSPPGWSAEVDGTRSFLIGPSDRQHVPIRLVPKSPLASARPVSTFVVGARLNRADDRSRDIVANVSVGRDATAEVARLGRELAKEDERHLGDRETATFDVDVAMSLRPSDP